MKKILLSCFALLLALCSFAQEIDLSKKYREDAINNSPYVFEGVIIKESYYTRNNDPVSSYIVRITKVMRGKLKSGTVEIVCHQNEGVVTDKRDVYDNKGSQRIDEDTLCIFFCKPATSELSYDAKYNIDTVDNNVLLSGYHNRDPSEFRMSVSHRRKGDYYGGLDIYFKTKVEVYQYLSKFKRLNIPADELKEKKVSEPKVEEKRSISMPRYTKQQSDSILKARDERIKLLLEKKRAVIPD